MRVRYNIHRKRPMYVSRASNPHNWTLESSDADTDIDSDSDSDSDSGSDQLPHPPPGQQHHCSIEVAARHTRAMHTDPLRRHELHLIKEDSAELRLHLLEEEVLKVERVRSPAPSPILFPSSSSPSSSALPYVSGFGPSARCRPMRNQGSVHARARAGAWRRTPSRQTRERPGRIDILGRAEVIVEDDGPLWGRVARGAGGWEEADE
ncbi:hypothetical protein LXA43DRAFT_634450 [Ganoderma leucocontextum]|nr:hypothetical protein LXA43DRAFT_634450 [Ganoderma leucocontextum]